MAGSTTEETPCQVTEDAKEMAILLAGPSGEDPPEGRRRQSAEAPQQGHAPPADSVAENPHHSENHLPNPS